MPALITHHLFGEKAATLLPDGIITDQEQLLAFLLGCQGPDPFFFRFRCTPSQGRACHELASRCHRERVAVVFESFRADVSLLPERDQAIGRAYVLGILCHYQLDRTCHPFVYAEQDEIIETAGDELAHSASQVHAIIEGRLDSWLLWHERHRTVLQDHPALELCRTPRIDKVAGALWSQVAWEVFGIELAPNQFGAAVNDMQAVYRLVEPAGSPRGEAIALVEERLRSTFSQVEAMAHEVVDGDEEPLANPHNLPWTDPETGAVRTEGLLDLLQEAREGWPELAEAFVRNRDLSGTIDRVDYSGRHTEVS